MPEITRSVYCDTLEQIFSVCGTCQGLHAPPFRFSVSLRAESFHFNASLAMYLVSMK